MSKPISLDGKTILHPVYGEVVIREDTYGCGGETALRMYGTGQYSGELISVLTVNIPGFKLNPNEFLIKTWSENQAIAEAALSSGLFSDTGKRVPTGFCEAQVWEAQA